MMSAAAEDDDSGTMQEDDQAEMMMLLQSTDRGSSERQLNADLRAKIYEQTRQIAELRNDEVNRQQTSKACRRSLDVIHALFFTGVFTRDRGFPAWPPAINS